MGLRDSFLEFMGLSAPSAKEITNEAVEVVPSPMPNLRISTEDYSNWPTLFGSRHAAMHCSDFIACESVKIRALRSLPVHILKREENGRFPANDHPMAKVLHRPNALMSWGDLFSWMVLRKDVFGTSYGRVIRDLYGNPLEIRPVLSSVKVSFDKQTGVAVYAGEMDKFNQAWTAREGDVVVFKTDISSNGGVTGRSIAEMSAQEIGLSIDLPKFYKVVLEKGNHMSGYLEHPDKLDLEDITAIKKSIDAQAGMDGAGGTRIYDRGLKYTPVQLKLAEMSLVEQERFILEKVCRATNVGKRHVGAETGALTIQDDIDFVKRTVLPEVTAFEQAFQVVLDGSASLGGADSGYRLKFNTNGLLRGDFKTRMEGYRIGIYAGMLTRAYCCEQEDIPWLPGQDKLLQPTAYYMVDENGNPYVPAQPTEGTSGQSDGVSGIDEKAVGNLLAPFIKNTMLRIEKRARADGDTEKTRHFAQEVSAPIILAAASAGQFIELEEEIEKAIERGTNANED